MFYLSQTDVFKSKKWKIKKKKKKKIKRLVIGPYQRS
jgi:hypothetical protein